MTAPDRALVGLQVGERRVDVAVPHELALYEVLRTLDVDLDDPRLVVVDSAGRLLDVYATRGAELSDGAVLHVLGARAASAEGARGGHAVGEPAASRPTGTSWWLGLAGVAGSVLVAIVLLVAVGGGRWVDDSSRLAIAGLLVIAGLSVVTVRDRPGATGVLWPALAGWWAGAAAGAVAVDPGLPAAGRLTVVTALVGATTVTAVRWAVTRRVRHRGADLALVLLVWSAFGAAATAGALLVGFPSVVAAALLLGVLPASLRVLPGLAVEVPDDQLLDVSLVARTASTVRAPEPRALGPVNGRAVARTVASAERRRDAGTVLAGVLAPVTGAALLLGAPATTLTRIAAVAGCALVALALRLQPRTARGAVVRWAPRTGALLLLSFVLVAGAQLPAALPDSVQATVQATVLATAVLGVGLVVAVVALPLGRGWRSVGASRAGDLLEGISTALALPAALVGAGAIELLRLATSA